MGKIGVGTLNAGGGGGGGNINVTVEPPKNPISYVEVVRLNGDLAGPIQAVAFREAVLDYDDMEILPEVIGTIGTTFTLSGIYRGWKVEVLRESVQDAEIEIDEIGYRIGVGNVTDTVLPFHNSDAGSYATQKHTFIAKAGARIEIWIERDNNTPESP